MFILFIVVSICALALLVFLDLMIYETRNRPEGYDEYCSRVDQELEEQGH